MEARHHVGHLHARVVDVVLHFDVLAARAQHADEGIAQDGIAQVADMRGLVGIDIGVLDDDLPGGRIALRAAGLRAGRAVRRAVEADVDVAVAGDFHRGDAFDRADFRNQFLRDLLRGLLQLLGKLKGDRHGQFAEIGLLGLFDRDLRGHAIPYRDMGFKGLLNESL